MMKIIAICLICVGLGGSVGTGAEAATDSCAAVEAGGGDPNAVRLAAGAEVEEILAVLENAGRQLQSFQAGMDYRQVQILYDTVILRNGRIYYAADGERVRAAIHFDDYVQKDIEEEAKGKRIDFEEMYIFDGKWLHHRNARTKTMNSWEVSKKAYNKEAFRLGKGPFPLPFAINKQDVQASFKVVKMAADQHDPADSIHLKLTPKDESSFAEEYVLMELWVSRKTALPVRIRYENTNYEITTVNWHAIKINQPLEKDVFELKPPGEDWTIERHPLEEK